MAVRVRRNGSKSPDRASKLKLALKQGRSAEAENVLSARKRRIDSKLRSLRISLQDGPVHVVAGAGGVRLHRPDDKRFPKKTSSTDQDAKPENASGRYVRAE